MIANVKSNNLDKAMTQEQFSQVVGAILEGKYSWACVLILRFAGYNPLHYIPYRTYNRLMKDNEALAKQSVSCRDDYAKPAKPKVVDLEYLDRCKQTADLRGGYIPYREELRYEPVFPLDF